MVVEDFRLKVFVAAARLGSFSAAAREFGITQPAVSRHIGELEKYTGARLFLRNGSRMDLTPTGRRLLASAEPILAAYADMDREFMTGGSILLKGVLNGTSRANILITDGRFADLDAPDDTRADRVVDASGLAIIPSFFNTHTHAAMTLLRGYADDLPLKQWLEDHIWPYEDRLTPDDIRRGSDIAAAEMLSSGSTFFSDMYFDIEQTIDSVDQSGMRAAIGITVMENHTKSVEEQKMDFVKNFTDPTGGRIQLVIAPHSVYTVGEKKLRRAADFARRHGLRLHIHVSETETEVRDCLREHGMTPVRYLDSIGFLGPDVIAAHCVHVDRQEWEILSRRRVTVSHCPCSNMKLGSGRFPYELAIESGCRITLGTDGASSDNCLDMLQEMKFAALLAKVQGNPTLAPAEEVFRWATLNGAEAFGIDAGKIEKGRFADAVLLDLSSPRMNPCHSLLSNVVYSADSSCIKAVLCGGRIVFDRGRKYPTLPLP